MWASKISRQELQQSIDQLEILTEVPGLPRENPMPVHVQSSYTLSMEQECQIASNLAFLAAAVDDVNKVMAVCVEEHQNGNAAIIRVSSNCGDISGVIERFKLLAKTLERAAQREITKNDSIQELFRHIISLDLPRILTRLRSRHAKNSFKTRGRPALITQLNNVLFDKSISEKPGLPDTVIYDLQSKAQQLKAMFGSLEELPDLVSDVSRIHKLLEEIVQVAHELALKEGFRTALQHFVGDPNLKPHLSNAIGKLGRYYSASKQLVCAARAKESRIFQNIQVESFNIQKPIASAGIPGKIHAEIKLLFFYELNPDQPRPRCICSSKNACFLCNLFFRLHGRFYIPQTHGKLYPQWVLPDWLDVPQDRQHSLTIVLTNFKASLDEEIQSASKSKERYPPPNESILLDYGNWSSSSTLSRSQRCPSLQSSASPMEGIHLGRRVGVWGERIWNIRQNWNALRRIWKRVIG
ncbi:hypothetical protein F5884DRAFT_861435 [Xylogone sp. PMI_703]|nr:hypothetical protein F5884DRAFT_861435 [Xylogone sp. PMI_703]